MKLTDDLQSRLKSLKGMLETQKLEAALVGNPRNLQYLTGKDTGRLIVGRDETILWVKDLYLELYNDIYSKLDLEVRGYEKDAVKEYINSSAIKQLGVENMGVVGYKKLEQELKPALIAENLVEKQRSVKSRYEIKQLKKAGDIAKKGIDKAYEVIEAGVPELYCVAQIESTIRKEGSESAPFESGMLLASGKHSADIHAYASLRKIEENSLVVVDLGARYNGYHSDVTRTLALGRVGMEEKKLLEFVENLRDETIDFVEVGMGASEIHSFVDAKMKKEKYQFYHSTGHGVGLQIHEMPNIGPGSKDILKENMAFTIEPGVYLAGKYGVRFEDTMLLGKNKMLLTR